MLLFAALISSLALSPCESGRVASLLAVELVGCCQTEPGFCAQSPRVGCAEAPQTGG